MNSQKLYEQIIRKSSYLCVGLDSDFNKIPKFLHETEYPLFEFNKSIINVTADLAVAYKPNLAFYESLGIDGMVSLELTVNYIRSRFPDMFIIADAKRGDIGNTSKAYAETFLKNYDFDAVTVSPYMGSDSIMPFLEISDKWAVLLALTSNKGAADFQLKKTAGGTYLYEEVLKISKEWGTEDNIMYVVGATKATLLKKVREIVPGHFLLIPGVGAQGGSLKEVSEYGLNSRCGLLVNASRSIIFADATENFADTARAAAKEMQSEMSSHLKNAKLK